MRTRVDDDCPLIFCLVEILCLIGIVANLYHSEIESTCRFADYWVAKFKWRIQPLNLVFKIQQSFLQKGISVRNAGCKEHFILIVLKLIPKAQIKECISLLNSIFISLFFAQIFHLTASRFPLFFALYRPHIRFHASLKQRKMFLKAINVKLYRMLDPRLDWKVKPLPVSSRIRVYSHITIILIIPNPNIIRFLLHTRCSSYRPKTLNWTRCPYWNFEVLATVNETKSSPTLVYEGMNRLFLEPNPCKLSSIETVTLISALRLALVEFVATATASLSAIKIDWFLASSLRLMETCALIQKTLTVWLMAHLRQHRRKLLLGPFRELICPFFLMSEHCQQII